MSGNVMVVNVRAHHYDVSIMRPHLLGNPFKIGRDGTREEVIRKYEEYARKEMMKKDNPFFKEMMRIWDNDLVMGCCCKPRACHGDVLIRLMKEVNP